MALGVSVLSCSRSSFRGLSWEKRGARFFNELALAMAGHSPGGPRGRHRGLGPLGTISGSSVATWPPLRLAILLMKKVGYKPEFAGAVEASASTGAFMPSWEPALIMSEFLGFLPENSCAADTLALLHRPLLRRPPESSPKISGVSKELPSLKEVMKEVHHGSPGGHHRHALNRYTPGGSFLGIVSRGGEPSPQAHPDGDQDICDALEEGPVRPAYACALVVSLWGTHH